MGLSGPAPVPEVVLGDGFWELAVETADSALQERYPIKILALFYYYKLIFLGL